MKHAILFGCCSILVLASCSRGLGESSASELASRKVAALMERLAQVSGDDKAQSAAIKDATLEKSEDVQQALLAQLRAANGIDAENRFRAVFLSLGEFGESRLCEALPKEEDATFKARLIRIVAHFRSAKSLCAVMEQLTDRREAEKRNALMEGAPKRVCDVAHNSAILVLKLLCNKAFEENWPPTPMVDRDKHIVELQGYWNTEREALLAKLKDIRGRDVTP